MPGFLARMLSLGKVWWSRVTPCLAIVDFSGHYSQIMAAFISPLLDGTDHTVHNCLVHFDLRPMFSLTRWSSVVWLGFYHSTQCYTVSLSQKAVAIKISKLSSWVYYYLVCDFIFGGRIEIGSTAQTLMVTVNCNENSLV